MAGLVNVTGVVTPELVEALNTNFRKIDEKIETLDELTPAQSTTSVEIGLGTKTFAVDKGFAVGGWVLATSDADPAVNQMTGQVVSYADGELVVDVKSAEGIGAFCADWTIQVSGGTTVQVVSGNLGFPTIAAMTLFVSATPNQRAYVAEDKNIYQWNAGTSAWVLVGPDQDARLTTLEETVSTLPTGSDSQIVMLNRAGYAIALVGDDGVVDAAKAAMQEDIDRLVQLEDNYGSWPTGGPALVINAAGYALGVLSGGSTTAATASGTVARVADVLDTEAEDVPLLTGKNISFTWGESKANGIDYIANAFGQIYAAEVGSLPVGVELGSSFYHYDGATADTLIADVANMRTAMDTAFTNGAKDVSFIALQEMANDMIASHSPDAWEASIDTVIDLIHRYALQKYSGTDPAVPIPPVFMTVDCTWSRGGLSPAIPLRAIEKAARDYQSGVSPRDYRFGVSAPDYICTFNGDYLHYTADDKKLVSAYHALAWYYWRHLKTKYRPTQVVEGWLQDNDFYLRCRMPHAPLVADTALVSSITQNGLVAYKSDGNTTAISGLTIVGGGTIIKGTTAASIAGGRIEGGLTATTSGTSGKATGPRMPYHDSSPYTFSNGTSTIHLYSAMLPFKVSF